MFSFEGISPIQQGGRPAHLKRLGVDPKRCEHADEVIEQQPVNGLPLPLRLNQAQHPLNRPQPNLPTTERASERLIVMVVVPDTDDLEGSVRISGPKYVARHGPQHNIACIELTGHLVMRSDQPPWTTPLLPAPLKQVAWPLFEPTQTKVFETAFDTAPVFDSCI